MSDTPMERVWDAPSALGVLRRFGYFSMEPSEHGLSLVELVLGFSTMRGGVLGHPDGNRVAKISRELRASGDVLVLLAGVAGPVFVHRKLFPALWRVLESPEFRSTHLMPEARTLLERLNIDAPIDITAMTSGLHREEAWRLLQAVEELHRWRLGSAMKQPRADGRVQVTLFHPQEWADEAVRREAQLLSYEAAMGELEALVALVSKPRTELDLPIPRG